MTTHSQCTDRREAAPHARRAPSVRRPRLPAAATPSKLEQIVALLSRPEGASLAELVAATGWQAHSVRGALAGSLKRKGHAIRLREGRRRAPLPDRSRAMTRRRTSPPRSTRLEHLDLEGLRALWRQRFGSRSRLRSPELLRLLLAWRLQAAALGRPRSRDAPPAAPAAGGCRPRASSSGSVRRLRRNWRGTTVEVVVEEDGFRWNDRLYPSLSAAATAIAGSRWNGPRFFGLRRPGP